MREYITEKDVETINKQTPETLANWWSIINSWECPDELEPIENWANNDHWESNTRGSLLMDYIETLIGHRACLRDANKDKTDEEFARWWGMQHTMNSDDFMNYWYPELAELEISGGANHQENKAKSI
jgi:hypothetical protein